MNSGKILYHQETPTCRASGIGFRFKQQQASFILPFDYQEDILTRLFQYTPPQEKKKFYKDATPALKNNNSQIHSTTNLPTVNGYGKLLRQQVETNHTKMRIIKYVSALNTLRTGSLLDLKFEKKKLTRNPSKINTDNQKENITQYQETISNKNC